MSLTLIDSSAWIEYLRGSTTIANQVEEHLRQETASLCEVIWIELYRGSKGKREIAILERLRAACVWLPVDAQTWKLAYSLSKTAMTKGVNCPLTDVIITACAIRHGAALLHRDKHLAALLKL